MTCALLAACSPTSSGGSGGGSSSGTNGTNGSNDGGTSGTADGTAGDGPVLPEGTLLYQRFRRADNRRDDSLIARDLATGDERVVTDLTGDGSDGWDIWGYSLSPDRRRIALASLYGPTAEDNETGLATRRIWTLAIDGTDFRRLTPTFPNDSNGRSSYTHEIGNPEWSADGSFVVFSWGSYWYEGTTLKGGSFPWTVSTAGDAPPSSFPTPTAFGAWLHAAPDDRRAQQRRAEEAKSLLRSQQVLDRLRDLRAAAARWRLAFLAAAAVLAALLLRGLLRPA